MYFGYDEKNTIRAIHILRLTEIQYFNPPILAIRHTSTYLPQTLPPDHDTLCLSTTIFSMTISIRHWQWAAGMYHSIFYLKIFAPTARLPFQFVFHIFSLFP